MSNDKRLGVNPLNWVDPTASGRNPIPVDNASQPETPVAAEPARALHESIIKPITTISEEDTMGKDKIKIKQTMDPAQIAAILEDLADSLTKGILRAESGEDSVVLCTGDTIHFEMKLSRKKDKAKCSIEMEWEDDGSKVDTFKISS